jgi:hypothetical protein
MGGETMGKMKLKIGPDSLKPSQVPPRMLADIFSELVTAFEASGISDPELFGLDAISSGCVAVETRLSGKALEMGVKLRDGSLDAEHPLLIWKRTTDQRCAALEWDSSLTVDDTEECQKPRKALVPDMTVLVGDIVGLSSVKDGGRIYLATDDGCKRTVSASMEQVKRLADRLFEVVALEVTCLLDLSTMAHVDFELSEVLPFRPSSLTELVDDMERLDAGRFDGVDLDAYCAAMRGR